MKANNFFDEPSRSFIEAFNGDALISTEVGDPDGISEASSCSSNSTRQTTSRDANGKDLDASKLVLQVRLWRYIFFGTIVALGVLMAISGKIFRSEAEVLASKEKYDQLTLGFAAGVEQRTRILVDSLKALSDQVTAEAVSTAASFPFVALFPFEVPAQSLRVMTDIEVVGFAPFVTRSLDPAWQLFVNGEQSRLKPKGMLASSIATDYGVDSILSLFSGHEELGQDAQLENTTAPVLHWSPAPQNSSLYNFDLFSNGTSGIVSFLDEGAALGSLEEVEYGTDSFPRSLIVYPVFANFERDRIAGILFGFLRWDLFISSVLPEDSDGLYVVLKDSCGPTLTFKDQGDKLQYLGFGDRPGYFTNTEAAVPLDKSGNFSVQGGRGCSYTISLYSTLDFEVSHWPTLFSVVMGIIFLSMVVVFCVYDYQVQLRNSEVLKAAEQSNALISSFFPGNVRKRLMEQAEENAATALAKQNTLEGILEDDLSDDQLDGDVDDLVMYKSKPIADLFPESSILFADISGFTAWSSVREPSQVFILLETLYRSYDAIAAKRRVFKVETVGDCYVAVTGVPDPRKDHAVAMCRFARECLLKTRVLVRKLEVTLGPDTGDLAMRMGIHSGPVTAGVLRGERSRFQLFGDTMNTAARMEHTGIRDKVQVSQETADLLIAAGKTNWITKREDVVYAKGKGELQTFWLAPTTSNSSAQDTRSSAGSTEDEGEEYEERKPRQSKLDPKTLRLIEWNVDVLSRLLKQITARRLSCPPAETDAPPNENAYQSETGVLDEVREIITLPEFQHGSGEEDPESLELPSASVGELHDYVTQIAQMYRDCPFHNFEHASHVTMSVVKLLSRIVAPQEYISAGERLESSLHDHTYGITSDPLTQFACVFSALIHDADHAGVSNSQLVKENDESSIKYNAKSVLEQKSIVMAWSLLMEPQYQNLRNLIYQNDAELKRFRQLVVNSVMATDIVDKELKTLRNLRWDRAFSSATRNFNDDDTINRKATIVIEHLIQASDVAHTMQHWHIYRKWNERFFTECYKAYQDGRAETDPSIGWYQGEIGFFDFYIIPLARKLKECGVFGVSSDEYLNYAIHNRQEWKTRGQEVVDEMVNNVKATLGK